MPRLKRHICSKRRLPTGIAAVGFAVLLAGVGHYRVQADDSGRASNDSCRTARPSVAEKAADDAIVDLRSARPRFHAALERRRGDGATAFLVAVTLPGNLDGTASVDERKATFISLLLPMIHRINEETFDHRRLVEVALACSGEGRSIDRANQAEIVRLHERYRTGGNLAALRQRLDIVPPSLAIAQAAIESGWGTSRFAVHGNALFGQRTTNPERGMRPADLTAATPVRVAAFDHLMASVRAYVHNLNTHPAYRGFRARRTALRRDGVVLDGLMLADTLLAYSSRGQAYVNDLKSVIRDNRLTGFDASSGTAMPDGLNAGVDT